MHARSCPSKTTSSSCLSPRPRSRWCAGLSEACTLAKERQMGGPVDRSLDGGQDVAFFRCAIKQYTACMAFAHWHWSCLSKTSHRRRHRQLLRRPWEHQQSSRGEKIVEISIACLSIPPACRSGDTGDPTISHFCFPSACRQPGQHEQINASMTYTAMLPVFSNPMLSSKGCRVEDTHVISLDLERSRPLWV